MQITMARDCYFLILHSTRFSWCYRSHYADLHLVLSSPVASICLEEERGPKPYARERTQEPVCRMYRGQELYQ